LSEARGGLVGPRLLHVFGVGVILSRSILDVFAEEIGDEGAVNAGTVKELREPPGRVLSELGLGVAHRVLGLALAIARLPFKTVCEESETVPRARRSSTRGGSG
jgi:hypothetical protein